MNRSIYTIAFTVNGLLTRTVKVSASSDYRAVSKARKLAHVGYFAEARIVSVS